MSIQRIQRLSPCGQPSTNLSYREEAIRLQRYQTNADRSLSLHDTDTLQGVRRGNYLRRSAQVLRRTVQPPLPRSKNAIDRSLRLLLRADGPVFVNERTVKQGGEARRLGKLWYTHDFAEKIFQEMLLNHAKVGIETESLEARESK